MVCRKVSTCVRCAATHAAKNGSAACNKRSRTWAANCNGCTSATSASRCVASFSRKRSFTNPSFPGLGDEFLEDLPEALGPDSLAKISAVGVIGHRAAQGQVEEPAKGHVGLDACHDLPVGEFVMEAQEQDFEHAHWVDGRPAHAQTVRLGEPRAKALEIDPRGHLRK